MDRPGNWPGDGDSNDGYATKDISAIKEANRSKDEEKEEEGEREGEGEEKGEGGSEGKGEEGGERGGRDRIQGNTKKMVFWMIEWCKLLKD